MTANNFKKLYIKSKEYRDEIDRSIDELYNDVNPKIQYLDRFKDFIGYRGSKSLSTRELSEKYLISIKRVRQVNVFAMRLIMKKSDYSVAHEDWYLDWVKEYRRDLLDLTCKILDIKLDEI